MDKDYFRQIIECPECKQIQVAEVENSIPFPVYIKECEKCSYIIMESEWNVCEPNVPPIIRLHYIASQGEFKLPNQEVPLLLTGNLHQ